MQRASQFTTLTVKSRRQVAIVGKFLVGKRNSMLTLALDTSSKSGSVAVFEDSELIQSSSIGSPSEDRQSSASNFSVDIRRLLDAANRKTADVGVIAVTVGPGSFTGLRVGVVAAKTLAYAVGCKIVGINSLSAIAAKAIEGTGLSSVCTAIDAQRGQLFAARFQADATWAPKMIGEVEIIDRNHLIDFADGDPVSGPGLERLSNDLSEVQTLDRRYWRCDAETVGRCSFPRAKSSSFDDLWTLKPQYYRASAAEEKRKSQTN